MKKYAIEIKWGVIFCIAIMIWMFGERMFGLHDEYISEHAIYTNFFGVVAIEFIFWHSIRKGKSTTAGS